MAGHPEWVWFDGAVVPWERATVHVSTATVLRGANVFEGVRAYWNGDERELYIFRNDEHMARLRNSAKIMRMPIPWSPEELTRAEIEVLRANRFEGTVWFRLTLYVGEGEGRTWPPSEGRIGGFILPRLSPHGEEVETGVDTCISTWTRIADTNVPPRVKAGANYHQGRLASVEARLNGFTGQPILLNERGKVSEGPGACLAMVRNGALVTPPITSNILESITRDTILELARDVLKIPVQEREIDRTEMYIADEAFFCGSGAEVTPITSVDHYPVGTGKPGPVTRRLQETYFSVAEGRVPHYRHWLTPVYGGVKAAARG
ncbi:MAG TPA: branched-chain amino acid transaminase [bacterium]|nr:branched-chain amino acid transaminase [bacterium]